MCEELPTAGGVLVHLVPEEPHQAPRPGRHHRRCRRRSERYRDLFAGRCPDRIRAALDGGADLADDGRGPVDQRAHRAGHRSRPGGKHDRRVPAAGGRRAGRAAVRRQHHQYRRRSFGHGSRREARGRRQPAPLHRAVRARLPDRHRVHSLSPLCRCAEVADLLAVRLCRHRLHRASRLARSREGRIAAALRAVGRFAHPGGRRVRHHDQPVPVLLAELAGSRGGGGEFRGSSLAREAQTGARSASAHRLGDVVSAWACRTSWPSSSC